MGSGQSSNSVKSINIDQETKDRPSRSPRKKTKKSEEITPEPKVETTEDVATARSPSPDKNTEVTELTRQLCESESLRLDLEDRIQVLEESLEKLNAQNLLQTEQPCDETLHAKDQYIAKLEKEKNDLQTDLNKIRQKHRRKLKQFNSQLAEQKQETNFQIMELKEEIQKLKQDNKKLSGSAMQGKNKSTTQYVEEEDTPKLPGGEKMKLILELSEQVTEQGDKITKLEKKLKDKDFTIDELRVKLKNNAEYLKSRDEKSDSNKYRAGAGDRNNNSALVGRSNSGVSAGRKSEGPVSKINVKSVSAHSHGHTRPSVEETIDEFDETMGMERLTSLLQGIKADNQMTRLSIDSVVDEPVAGSSHGGISIVEERAGSRTGRDSGLGSAGKREEEKVNTIVKNNTLDWNSLESGLSDSDVDSNNFIQSKIASAPPKLQNGKNQRLKKKTGSLRKHSQKIEDKPPRPGLAFVSTTTVSHPEDSSDIWDGHPISSKMSTVNVA